ncbi:MAG: hypothetical protein AB7T10_03900 [bacterium]
MKKTCFILISCLSMLLGAQVNFHISPPRQEFTISKNENKTFKIDVYNKSDTTLHIKAYSNDWSANSEGEVLFFKPGLLKNSCSEWLYINPQEFNLNAGTSQEVRISLSSPNDVYGDYWSVIFFESTPFNLTGKDMLMFSGRVGSYVYATIAGTTAKNGDIVGLDFDKKEYRVKAVFENTGNVHVRVKGFMQILKGEKIIYEKTVEERLSLPESKTNIYFPVETELQKGEYLIKVTLDYSGSEILEGEKRITIN